MKTDMSEDNKGQSGNFKEERSKQRQRRPDQQVYVPRGRRSKRSDERDYQNELVSDNGAKSEDNGDSKDKQRMLKLDEDNKDWNDSASSSSWSSGKESVSDRRTPSPSIGSSQQRDSKPVTATEEAKAESNLDEIMSMKMRCDYTNTSVPLSGNGEEGERDSEQWEVVTRKHRLSGGKDKTVAAQVAESKDGNEQPHRPCRLSHKPIPVPTREHNWSSGSRNIGHHPHGGRYMSQYHARGPAHPHSYPARTFAGHGFLPSNRSSGDGEDNRITFSPPNRPTFVRPTVTSPDKPRMPPPKPQPNKLPSSQLLDLLKETGIEAEDDKEGDDSKATSGRRSQPSHHCEETFEAPSFLRSRSECESQQYKSNNTSGIKIDTLTFNIARSQNSDTELTGPDYPVEGDSLLLTLPSSIDSFLEEIDEKQEFPAGTVSADMAYSLGSNKSNDIVLSGASQETDPEDREVEFINSTAKFEELLNDPDTMKAFYSQPNLRGKESNSVTDLGRAVACDELNKNTSISTQDFPQRKASDEQKMKESIGKITWAAGWGSKKFAGQTSTNSDAKSGSCSDLAPKPHCEAVGEGVSVNSPDPAVSSERHTGLGSGDTMEASGEQQVGLEMAELLLQDDIDEIGVSKSGVKTCSSRESPKNGGGGTGLIDSWEQLLEVHDVNLGRNGKKVGRQSEIPISTASTKPIDYYSAIPCSVASDQSGDEFANVLEVYGFTSEMKTDQLHLALNQLGCQDFTIKWVDDNHAVAVFRSSVAAQSALSGSLHHPTINVRAISNSSAQTKKFVSARTELLVPAVPRPVTNPSLARRLVEGHLGVKSGTSREQRSMERKLLEEAKERKKQAQQLQLDMWEGCA